MENKYLDFVSEILSKDDALPLLRQWLERHFSSPDKLKILSSDLRISYASLVGESIRGKINDLAEAIINRQQVPNLINYLRNDDPILLKIFVKHIINERNSEFSAYKLTQASADTNAEPETAIKNEEIFISYKWGGQGEEVVNELDKAFKKRGVTIIRDKGNVGYKEDIKKFMKRLGQGKCVIAVICDEYLKSYNCMLELVEVDENGDFDSRIFPIVIDDAKINKTSERLQYVHYWENEIDTLDREIRKLSSANLHGIREDLDTYVKIRSTISKLMSLLNNINTFNTKMHIESDFEAIFTSISRKLSQ